MLQAPSMTSLRALESVLRHGTLSGAARELCVTPAAISHRLRDLERAAGQPLALRRNGQFQPTKMGREVQKALGDAFDRIRAANMLLTATHKQSLRIAAAYSFAVLWLLPNLSRFEADFPEVEIFLNPTHDPLAALKEGSDFVVLHGNATPPQGTWSTLFEDHCAAYCRSDNPVLEKTISPADLLRQQRLVHIAHRSGPAQGEYSWADWAEDLNANMPFRTGDLHVTAEHVAADVIAKTDAIALLGTTNASERVAQGALTMIPGTEVSSGHSYRIWCAAPANAAAANFESWLREMLDR